VLEPAPAPALGVIDTEVSKTSTRLSQTTDGGWLVIA